MRNRNIFLILLAALVLSALASLMIGSTNIPLDKIFSSRYCGILHLRLSRLILAAVAGASLAVVGALLQGLLKNPLADPYVIGISSGAGLGAVAAIVFGLHKVLPYAMVPLAAFISGIVTIFFVYALSKKGSRVGTEDLLLSGVIISSILSGLIMFIVSVFEAEGAHSGLWWLLGNTQIYDAGLLMIVCLVSITGIILAAVFSRNLNIMSLGEEEAIASGLDVEKVKFLYFIISSLITACIVSVCGLIGFVGLIVPHAARRLTGPDHRILIPASALLGGAFLVICDIAARRITAPFELPIGVVTAIIGGPFFILMIKKLRRPSV